MIPMFVASIILYGPRAVALTAVTVIACLLTEAVANTMRGRSLAGVVFGSQENTYAKDTPIGGEMINGKWMRKGEYKAVLVAKPWGPGSWRLYNTARDPGETTDLSTQHTAILKELTEAWDRYAKDVGVVLSK